MENDMMQTILRRRSIRAYDARQVEDEAMRAIVSAGQYAPNACAQAWHFAVVQNADLLREMGEAAKETARQMGEHLAMLGNAPNFSCLYGAPTLVVLSSGTESVSGKEDCSAALENMLLAADSLGVGSCWVFFILLAFMGSRGEEFKQRLSIPVGFTSYTAGVFGYAAGKRPEPEPRIEDAITWIR